MHQIQLFGTIGRGYDFFSGTEALSSQWLANELEGQSDVEILINSDGGEVFEAQAMMQLLRAHPGATTARVIALAASSASFLMLGADRVEMAPGSQLMIHNPYTQAGGTATELRKSADMLDHVNDTTVVPAYQSKTGMGADEIKAMLNAETWIDTDMALDLGFIDGIAQGAAEPIAALLRVGISGNSPAGVAPLSAKAYRAELSGQLARVRRLPLERQQNTLSARLDQVLGRKSS